MNGIYMSSREDELEYKLEKVHREIIEEKLGQINQNLSEYYEYRNEMAQRRRRENIYVLLAVGIVGAFFSVLPKDTFTISGTFLIGFGIFASASFLFLLFKLNTIAIPASEDSEITSGKLNTYADYIFAFSINGSVVLVGIIIMINLYEISLTQLQTSITTGATGIIAILAGYMQRFIFEYWEKRKKRERIDRIKNEIPNQIEQSFTELAQVDEQKKRLEKMHKILSQLDHLSDELSDSEIFIDLLESLDNTPGITDDIQEVVQARLEEIIEEKTKDKPTETEDEEESLKEVKNRLQNEYEQLLSLNEE